LAVAPDPRILFRTIFSLGACRFRTQGFNAAGFETLKAGAIEPVNRMILKFIYKRGPFPT
jgi:hypothetical protein